MCCASDFDNICGIQVYEVHILYLVYDKEYAADFAVAATLYIVQSTTTYTNNIIDGRNLFRRTSKHTDFQSY